MLKLVLELHLSIFSYISLLAALKVAPKTGVEAYSSHIQVVQWDSRQPTIVSQNVDWVYDVQHTSLLSQLEQV